MPPKQRLTWTVVLRLAVVVTAFASLVVLGGGTALLLVEGGRPDSTVKSWGDAFWWSLTTVGTVVVLGQAAAVAGLAFLQVLGLRREP